MGVAPAHLDAHRADPAVPAGGRERPRVTAAAGRDQPGGGVAVLRRAPEPGPHPGAALAVQRVRRALVRRDLPAAVPVPGRLRAAADAAPGRFRAPAAAAGAAPRGPAADVGELPDGAGAGGGARVGRGGAVRPAFPDARGRGLGGRGKGLPARGRQPAFPHRAARGAGLDRPRRALRLQGRPAARRGHLVLQHGDGAGRVPPRPPGLARRPAAVHADPRPVQRGLRDVGGRVRPAGLVQRGDQLLGRARRAAARTR